MKKFLLVIACTLIVQISQLLAQNSLGVSIGYGLPAASQLITTKYTYQASNNSSNEKGVYGSYGSGLVVNASYAHFFSSTVGFSVDALYLSGKKNKGESRSTAGTSVTTSTSDEYARGFFINPSVILALDRQGIKPYAKLGISIGQAGFFYESAFLQVSPSGQSSRIQNGELKGGLGFGLTSAIGIDIPLTEKFNLFTEVNFTSMSYYSKSFEITEYTVNGKDMLSTIPSDQRKGTFKKEVSDGGSSTQSNVALSQPLPMGAVRLTVGIKVNLGGK